MAPPPPPFEKISGFPLGGLVFFLIMAGTSMLCEGANPALVPGLAALVTAAALAEGGLPVGIGGDLVFSGLAALAFRGLGMAGGHSTELE